MSAPTKHGESLGGKSRLYRIWSGLRNRCMNPTNPDYPQYGGRGIYVHFEWDDYLVFKDWALANGYTSDLQIDRQDTNGPYSPENCRWVDRIQQRRNQRRTKTGVAFGETKTIAEWGQDPRCVVSYETFRKRVASGWPIEEALTLVRQPNGAHRQMAQGGSSS